MRKVDACIPVFAAAMIAFAGCQQTTATTGSNSMTPIGPLAPVSPGQTPILGPFGGPTRVTPPPTGSFNANPGGAYLGTPPNTFGQPAAPNPAFSSPPTSFNSTGTFNSTASFNAPIGSGVQPAAWTETQSAVNAAGRTSSGQPATGPQAMNPRRGGMPVIDLTGAPNPPGYQPTFSPSIGYPSPPQTSPQAPTSVNPTTAFPRPSPSSFGGNVANRDWQTTPSMTNQRAAMQPQTNMSPQGTMQPQSGMSPPTTSATPSARSTPPSTASQNLPWRAPGSGF